MREIPFRPSRVIHFFPPQIDKVVAKLPDVIPTVDILLGNLEDAIPMADKEAARAGLVAVARSLDMGDTQLWTRVNSLDSPWALDDLTTLVTEIGDKLDVIMVPKVEGPEDIHYVDRLLAQLEAKAGLDRPILVHAILETARGVANIEEICAASPRMQGLSLGPGRPRRQPTDEDDPRRRRPPRLPRARRPRSGASRRAARRRFSRTCGTTRWPAWSTPASTFGLLPFYGPFGDIKDTVGLRGPVPQRLPARLRRCMEPAPRADRDRQAGVQPAPRRRRPRPAGHRRDGRRHRAIMLDGKMEDDASVKQCKVVVELAHQLATTRSRSSPRAYGFDVVTDLRPRRSVLYMPAANERALEKAKTLAGRRASSSISRTRSPPTPRNRRASRRAPPPLRASTARRELTIRCNGLDTAWGAADLAAIAASAAAAVVVPKVGSVAYLDDMSAALDAAGAPDAHDASGR